MKYFIVLFLYTVILSSCETTAQSQATNTSVEKNGTPVIKTVKTEEFKQLVDSGNGIILDVRTPQEIAQGYIPNASMINFYDEDFEKKVNLIDKSKEIYVYCKVGGRSSEAVKVLKKAGFQTIYELSGGFMAWERQNLPIAKTEIAPDEHIQTLSLNEFEELLKSDKPVLVDFHTIWCAPCRKMAPIVDKLEKDYKDKATVMRIDVDKCKDIANAYQVSAVPVFVLFKNGKAMWNHTGVLSEEELKSKLEANM